MPTITVRRLRAPSIASLALGLLLPGLTAGVSPAAIDAPQCDENSGHWRNSKDLRWKTFGIGVWVYGGRVRLVTDLYQP